MSKRSSVFSKSYTLRAFVFWISVGLLVVIIFSLTALDVRAEDIPGLPPPDELAEILIDELKAQLEIITGHIVPAISIALIIRKMSS